MADFIEVTKKFGETPLLLNPAAIERVEPSGTGARITFIGGNLAGEAERVEVTDAYADVKRKLRFHPA